MKFSVIHPTARVTSELVHSWYKAMYSARNGCDNPRDVEYIVVVHCSRTKAFWDCVGSIMIPQWGRFQVVTNYGRDCLVDQCNAGMLAASGEIHVWNQDDMRYPDHWDTEIAKLIPDSSALVCVQTATDGGRRDLLTLPTICTQLLQEAIGAISDEYESMYLDDEWSLKARALGVVIPAPHLYFQHLHPVNGTAKMDAVYALENREEAYEIGREVFERRRALGFPRVPFARERRRPVAARTIVLAIPGEFHRAEWTLAFVKIVAGLSNLGWNVRVTPGFSTNVYQSRMGITRDIIKDAAALGEPEMVLWIDDDNTPSIEAVFRLIGTLDTMPEISGASGWCWILTKDQDDNDLWMTSCGKWDGASLRLKPIALADLFAGNHAPKEIDWSGFPTLLIRYEALLKLGPESFKPIMTEDNAAGFTGEDISFFLRATDFKFVVVPDAEVFHWKVRPLRPDYTVKEGASSPAVEAIERERRKLNGPRVEVSRDVKEFMEATKV